MHQKKQLAQLSTPRKLRREHMEPKRRNIHSIVSRLTQNCVGNWRHRILLAVGDIDAIRAGIIQASTVHQKLDTLIMQAALFRDCDEQIIRWDVRQRRRLSSLTNRHFLLLLLVFHSRRPSSCLTFTWVCLFGFFVLTRKLLKRECCRFRLSLVNLVSTSR